MEIKRLQETEEQSSLRKLKNASRMAIKRSLETKAESSLRKQKNAYKMALKRSQKLTAPQLNIHEIVLADIEKAKLRSNYQKDHPLLENDMTYRTYKVLTSQEYQNNVKIL